MATELNRRAIPGLRFYPTRFTPVESRLMGVPLEGIRIEIVDRERVPSVRLGLELACALQRLYPGRMAWGEAKRLFGSDDALRRVAAGEDAATIERSFRPGLAAFAQRRARYLLYR